MGHVKRRQGWEGWGLHVSKESGDIKKGGMIKERRSDILFRTMNLQDEDY